METWRKLVLTAVAVVLLVLTVLTWGSIGSLIFAFCLILMACALLVQWFVLNRSADDYQMEE